MVNSSVVGVVAVVLIVAASFGTYYVTATPIKAQVASYQTNVSSYQSVISSMSAHPSTTTIVTTTTQTTISATTNTSTITATQTTTSTSLITSTVTSYPIPDNVTVYLVSSGSFTNYGITAGSYSTSGSLGGSQRFYVTPVYQGETITITINLSCPGSNGPTASSSLYVNSTIVSQSTLACGGTTSGQISYVL